MQYKEIEVLLVDKKQHFFNIKIYNIWKPERNLVRNNLAIIAGFDKIRLKSEFEDEKIVNGNSRPSLCSFALVVVLNHIFKNQTKVQ